MIERPRIVENEQGSTITVVYDDATGEVTGVITVKQDDKIAYISGSLDVITGIGYEVDEYIAGKIVTIDSYEPPIPEDTEMFLRYSNDDVKVYRIYVYSFNENEKDQII